MLGLMQDQELMISAIVKHAADGVEYKATVIDNTRWTAEWRIPFAALGINPATQTRFEFNCTIRKTANDQWVMWHGTHGNSWVVGNAGIIELGK